MTQDNLKQQVLHSIKWVALGKAATQLIRWIITFWVIRLLTPEDYGEVAMADVLFGFFTLMLGSFITPSIIQAKELSTHTLKKLFGAIILVYCTFFIVQLSLADAVGRYYQSSNVADILSLNAWCF